MAERRSALDSVYAVGRHGAEAGGAPGVSIRERRDLAMTQVACFPDDGKRAGGILQGLLGFAPPRSPNRAAEAGQVTALWLGPHRWLLVESGGRSGFDLALRDALSELPGVAVTDLGQARCVLRLSGPAVRGVLAKGCPLDLHPQSFDPGACAQSLFGHVTVLLHAADRDVIDLYVARSFAQSLFEDLTHQAAEVGVLIEPSTDG